MRVLIVDDEPAVLGFLSRSIRGLGWTTAEARSFAEARDLLAIKPDALVADVRLGGYNGVQLAILARQADAHVRIVLVSGHDDPVIRQEAANCDATFLVKPFTPGQLVDAINRST